MKKKIWLAVMTAALAFTIPAAAQVTSIPETAKENFAKQYPTAENIRWDNDVINVNVRFDLDGAHMNAEYNNKGIWKHTYKDMTVDEIPAAVNDGLAKSKYAGRDITEVKEVMLPGSVTQYLLKVEKNDLQKKFLYFNPDGRLVRDANTL